eukprot:scaffold322861_cov38-Prasinocladus_malaysianus.AAC.1
MVVIVMRGYLCEVVAKLARIIYFIRWDTVPCPPDETKLGTMPNTRVDIFETARPEKSEFFKAVAKLEMKQIANYTKSHQ